jgi:hypothetical protein
MLKRNITYEDFDGNTVTEEFHFNVSKSELVELEVDVDDGFSAWIQTVIKSKDNKELLAQFKRIVLLAYGKKSEDGKYFEKSEEMRRRFSQSNAFEELFIELATVEGAAATFIQGVLPKDLTELLNDDTKKQELQAATAEALGTQPSA